MSIFCTRIDGQEKVKFGVYDQACLNPKEIETESILLHYF